MANAPVSHFHKWLLIIMSVALAGLIYLVTVDTMQYLDGVGDENAVGQIVKHFKKNDSSTEKGWKTFIGKMGSIDYTIKYPEAYQATPFPKGVDTDGVTFEAASSDENIILTGLKITIAEREAVFGSPVITKKTFGDYTWDCFLDESGKLIIGHSILSSEPIAVELFGPQRDVQTIDKMLASFQILSAITPTPTPTVTPTYPAGYKAN